MAVTRRGARRAAARSTTPLSPAALKPMPSSSSTKSSSSSSIRVKIDEEVYKAVDLGQNLSDERRVDADVDPAEWPLHPELHPSHLKEPRLWWWKGVRRPVRTVNQLVWMLIRIAFEALRPEFRAPYMHACRAHRHVADHAALMAIRQPLMSDGPLPSGNRYVCMRTKPALSRAPYAVVNFGRCANGRPVRLRLHTVLTYILHGPPRPGEVAAHSDGCNPDPEQPKSDVCRSRHCLCSRHLRWQPRAQNSGTGALGTVKKIKKARKQCHGL
jgi:hypothetical protein